MFHPAIFFAPRYYFWREACERITSESSCRFSIAPARPWLKYHPFDIKDPLLDDNDHVEPPEHLLNPSPYRLPKPSSTEAPIMSGEKEINGFYSSPSADEMSKGRAKASKSAADVTNQPTTRTRPVLTDTNGNESERQQPSSPIVMPDARRLFQTTAKKPNRECNEDTLKSKRSE